MLLEPSLSPLGQYIIDVSVDTRPSEVKFTVLSVGPVSEIVSLELNPSITFRTFFEPFFSIYTLNPEGSPHKSAIA